MMCEDLTNPEHYKQIASSLLKDSSYHYISGAENDVRIAAVQLYLATDYLLKNIIERKGGDLRSSRDLRNYKDIWEMMDYIKNSFTINLNEILPYARGDLAFLKDVRDDLIHRGASIEVPRIIDTFPKVIPFIQGVAINYVEIEFESCVGNQFLERVARIEENPEEVAAESWAVANDELHKSADMMDPAIMYNNSYKTLTKASSILETNGTPLESQPDLPALFWNPSDNSTAITGEIANNLLTVTSSFLESNIGNQKIRNIYRAGSDGNAENE